MTDEDRACEPEQTDESEHAADHEYIRARRLRCEYAQQLIRQALENAVTHGILIAIAAAVVALNDGARAWILHWLSE